MRSVYIAKVALLLLAIGCGSEEPEPGGQAGTTAGGSAGTAGHAGGTAGVSASASGHSGAGASFPTSGAGRGGIGAVDPYLSTGGAGEPFQISCTFGDIDYEIGDAIPSIDGCNVCTCGSQGIECSDRECRGQLSADGDLRDGDPYIACDDFDDCPAFDCPCSDDDSECDKPCVSYSCVTGICVNMGSRSCSPEDTSACLDNEFCDYGLDAACGTRGRGYCSLIHNERRCTPDEWPACGCDGVRYRNACFVRAAGQASSPTDTCE